MVPNSSISKAIQKEANQKKIILDQQIKNNHQMQIQSLKTNQRQIESSRSPNHEQEKILSTQILDLMDQELQQKLEMNKHTEKKTICDELIARHIQKIEFLNEEIRKAKSKNPGKSLLDRFKFKKLTGLQRIWQKTLGSEPPEMFEPYIKTFGDKIIADIQLQNMILRDGGKGYNYVDLQVSFGQNVRQGNVNERNFLNSEKNFARAVIYGYDNKKTENKVRDLEKKIQVSEIIIDEQRNHLIGIEKRIKNCLITIFHIHEKMKILKEQKRNSNF